MSQFPALFSDMRSNALQMSADPTGFMRDHVTPFVEANAQISAAGISWKNGSPIVVVRVKDEVARSQVAQAVTDTFGHLDVEFIVGKFDFVPANGTDHEEDFLTSRPLYRRILEGLGIVKPRP
jgi:hypothetical protein